MSIGTNIKHFREAKNLTQTELAKNVGITQSMLSQVERDSKTISLQLSKQIAKIFGCTIDDLAKD